MQTLVETFIQAANSFHIEAALSVFAADAVIDDVSVGDAFMGLDAVRDYLERFLTATTTRRASSYP